ncbi:DBF4-type zinc finger-containing protein 2 [Trichomycterus rosablanca]|uniref:DBF4-type zinc finger-containing protein 2 n=1 Tax=Trichomycterus rosablanca TaxID=2290929 RepID=UPI002F3518C8
MPLDEGPAPTAEDADREHTDMASRPSSVEQPVAGPSNTSQRQGFCSYCQVLYNSVEQHIASSGHKEVVQRAARANVSPGGLMERFLRDVLQHHPHCYNDTRPTHADLPFLSTLPIPKEELSELHCGSEHDGLSVGTREDMPSSDDESCQIVQAEATSYRSTHQQQAGTSAAGPMDFVSETHSRTSIKSGKVKNEPPVPEKYSPTQGFFHRTSGDSAVDKQHTSQQLTQTPQTQPCEQPGSSHTLLVTQHGSSHVQHRKAHRKTNRHRKNSNSSLGSPASPATKCITSKAPHGQSQPALAEPVVEFSVLPSRKDSQREWMYSNESDQICKVIEEVIERHCYGRSPKSNQPEEESVFHFSLRSRSESKDSEEWDNALQITEKKPTTEEKHLAGLRQIHINLEDEGYKSQLDTALNTVLEGEQAEPKEVKESKVEEIIPDLPHIPPSFVGKTWTQVMFEDDLKIEQMVKEFRQGQFRCYFDSESLAKFGKRCRKGKRTKKREKIVDDIEFKDVLPLAEHYEEDEKRLPVFRKTRHKIYRMASRCQVVKVSHGTQTAPLSYPVVRRQTLTEARSLHTKPHFQKDRSPERTPDMTTRLCALKLPASYCKIMSPVQPKTVVYVLSSPDAGQGTLKPALIKRIGRKRKSNDEECTPKYKYKKTPLKYYDPLTNRILKTPPRSTPSTPMTKSLSHVRQLFRSLSPDINKEFPGSVQGRSPRGSKKDSSVMADLCPSTSGSCLNSSGPSEPGSSQSSSRRALFSHSSISTSSYFFGHIRSSASHSSSKAKASSYAGSSLKVEGTMQAEDHAQAHKDQPPVRRRKQSPRVTEKTLTPAKKPSAPPYRTKRKSAKARAKSGNILQQRLSTRIAAGCRVSPRNKTPTRASARSSSYTLDT